MISNFIKNDVKTILLKAVGSFARLFGGQAALRMTREKVVILRASARRIPSTAKIADYC